MLKSISVIESLVLEDDSLKQLHIQTLRMQCQCEQRVANIRKCYLGGDKFWHFYKIPKLINVKA